MREATRNHRKLNENFQLNFIPIMFPRALSLTTIEINCRLARKRWTALLKKMNCNWQRKQTTLKAQLAIRKMITVTKLKLILWFLLLPYFWFWYNISQFSESFEMSRSPNNEHLKKQKWEHSIKNFKRRFEILNQRQKCYQLQHCLNSWQEKYDQNYDENQKIKVLILRKLIRHFDS